MKDEDDMTEMVRTIILALRHNRDAVWKGDNEMMEILDGVILQAELYLVNLIAWRAT